MFNHSRDYKIDIPLTHTSLPAFKPGGWRRTPKRSSSLSTSALRGPVRNSPSSMSASPALKVCYASTTCEPSALSLTWCLKVWSFVDVYSVAFLSAVGVTNQRETTLVWDKETGEPLYRAIGECGMH